MLSIQPPPGLKKNSYYEEYNFYTEKMIVDSTYNIIDLTRDNYEYTYDKETLKNTLFSINSIFTEEFIERHRLKVKTNPSIRSNNRVQSKYLKNKSSNSLNQIIFYRKNLNGKKYFDKRDNLWKPSSSRNPIFCNYT